MDIQQEDEEEDGEGGLEAQVYSQCCGTVKIFYGSGFGLLTSCASSSAPGSVSSTVFIINNFGTNLAFLHSKLFCKDKI